MVHAISAADFDRLKPLDTCSVSNAIERLNVRLRNEGFASSAARCVFPQLAPTLGYAVTATIRTSEQPVTGGWYYDRLEWWAGFQAVPAPRVLVLQDIDRVPGFAAFVGEVHANIAAALDCVACVTNGAVRDVPAIEALGFQLFAGGIAPSHAYAHVVEWGLPVEIGGLTIQQGDLLHGDCHGIQTIPVSIAPEVPAMVQRLRQEERELIDLCRSPDFSIDALSGAFERLRHRLREPESPASAGRSTSE
jgi:regulator of RNase E activity RraA